MPSVRSAAPPRSGSLPTHLWIPEGARLDAAQEAADLARALGDDVEAPEEAALSVLLAEDAKGRRIGLESAVFCGRQNLKTWAAQRMVIYRAWVHDLRRIVWTAHLYKTTQDTFNELTRLIEAHAWLEQQVLKISYGNGEESIFLRNGCQIDFVARSQRSARGWSADEVVADEGLYLTPEMFGAVLPTLSARPDPHFVHLSSPGLLRSDVIRSVRDRGRAGGDPSLAFAEWTSEVEPCELPACSHLPGVEGCQLDDEDKWLQANPGAPRRITLSYVRSERRALPPMEFMRERMGWWEDPGEGGSGAVFPIEDFEACNDPEARPVDGAGVAWSVDVSWDRSTAWVAKVSAHPDGLPIVKWTHRCDPMAVMDWLTTNVDRSRFAGIAVQGSSAPVSSLLDDLRREFSDDVQAMNTTDIVSAAGGLYDSIKGRMLWHNGQPEIQQAVSTCTIRPLGDGGWAIDRKKSPTDVSPLVAVANALWLWRQNDDTADPGVWFL